MRGFALTCEALANLDSVEGKVQCAAAYLISRAPQELAVAARFLAGTPLPPGATPANVGGATIATVVAEHCGTPATEVRRRAVSTGDLGTAVAGFLQEAGNEDCAGLALTDAAVQIAELGAVGAAARTRRLRRLFEATDPLEAKYLTKLLVGSLRTGMQQGRVEEVIALAFRRPVEAVRRAHMLIGDIGIVAERARSNELDETRLRTFRPVRCMLAHPVDDAAGVLEHFQLPVIVEPKFDGIRAQMHVRAGQHRIYSRNLEDLTHQFPELGAAADALDGDYILDGEIVAWVDGPLPFEQLQQRLGRRQVPLTLLLDVPVVYFVFDVLHAAGRDLIDEPLQARKAVLEELCIEGTARRLEHRHLSSADDLGPAFEEALAEGHEGIVVKDPASAYHPGTRGRDWLKLKRPLGTLDVVVTAAQYGRGKRAGWLSDLTFAVRDGDEALRDVGKAYSGLTDAEIRQLTEQLKLTTRRRLGDVHVVDPSIVLEVTFSAIQRSGRHASGFALRFPRIVRLRQDMGVDDVDSLERLEEMFTAQRKGSSQH